MLEIIILNKQRSFNKEMCIARPVPLVLSTSSGVVLTTSMMI